jgi:hypothetical protein
MFGPSEPLGVELPVWRIRAGERDRDALTCWRQGEPTLGVWLERLEGDGRRYARPLARVAVEPASWRRTIDLVQHTIARWWLRILASDLDGPALEEQPVPLASEPTIRRHAVALRTAARLAGRKLRHHAVGEAWRVGVRHRTDATDLLQLSTFHWLTPPAGAFDADPFLAVDGSRTWLFFERLFFNRGVGEIWCAPLDAAGRPGVAKAVMQPAYHLAFPQVFQLDGSWWMVPDCSDRQGVHLFRASHFPDQWALEEVWLPGRAWVDPVLHHDGERWWLLVTPIHDGPLGHDELYAFWSEHWRGPWQPHPGNPVVADVRWARNAGRLQQRDGHCWRVAQDCGAGYGAGLALRRIDALTPTAYHERTVWQRQAPSLAGIDGFHTWNQAGDFETIDVRHWLPGR